MASFAKLPLLLATALFYNYSFIPPTLPPSAEEQKRTNTLPILRWYERVIVPILPVWTRMTYWAFFMTEAMVLFRATWETNFPANVVVDFTGNHDSAGRVTVPFVFGAGLIATGAMIRFRCFREMGRHFTFALSLRDGHKLISTGPYAIVRHPSYTGGNMTIVGAALTLMHDGSWWFGGGYRTGWGLFLAANFIVSSLLVVRAFLRGNVEDAYLRASFKEEWQAFADRVPYRYIPGVY
ncbi:hypothetical protein C8F04DRAFT_1230895 [Mycena alexandri]|uniref:Protein-S-isoprenylcysteine O-methyltransferase n=1 Tax=Mycena alexandri TaxID=1745969 RepID=A0AAD6TB00_9AGAR|nr:hypothetical protein C8F04DRAFT_1230895 [Mycena alexandri]